METLLRLSRLSTLALLLPIALAATSVHATVVLRNALWTIELQPGTLAIAVTPHTGLTPGEAPPSPTIEVSRGGPGHTVHDLRATPTEAAWHWDPGPAGPRYRLAARLDGADLSLSIVAMQPGRIALLRQPAAAMGRGLALPLAEGHYIPAGDARWREFLLREMAEFDTSESISLPLWTLDQGTHTLSWILGNRYNNTAAFARDGAGLSMTLDHDYTALDLDSPMALTLHLGGPDPLAGARRYRAGLAARDGHARLADKIRRMPSASRLLGASHVYLWGNGLLAPRDVRDWPGFLARLRGGDPLPTTLRAHMDKDLLRTLTDAGAAPDAARRAWTIRGVNEAFDAVARAAWQTATPDMHALATRYGELRREAARTFGATLSADPARWGAGVSVATIAALAGAGLPRLWIGLGQGWEGGLWHPEAIADGVRAGYLVAPYDSYETALPPGQQPGWASAQLGLAAYRDCGIRRADGRLQPGFQGAGHYTDPACVRPLLQARVQAVRQAVPFNSWFIDVYATGMAFDNHAAQAPTPQRRYVAESAASLRWMADVPGLPVGSEGGNAAVEDIVFAHGMQTPVIGWTDPDLHRDRRSPWFLGAWYPDDEPAKFFQATPLKPPYAAIHFDPATRLPLYQAVYHGSVITTHHWLFDNLKLANVRAENALLQLLYNVPPLFHLSSATLARRLPEIVRHDAFFRPLHERLATQALTAFEWLAPDRRVQRTAFEDGTSLVANFRDTPYAWRDTTIPGRSVAAFTSGQQPVVFRAEPAKAP